MITVKATPLLIESGDTEVDKFNAIFERVLLGGYEYFFCGELDDVDDSVFKEMISLRPLADDLMMEENEDERNDERAAFMEAHPYATEEEIDEHMEAVDEEISYNQSYHMNYYDDKILDAAKELGYCVLSNVDITWGKEGKGATCMEVTIFNCPQRNLLLPPTEDLGSMEFMEIF